ncbi:response regulator [Paenibacillus koleovorans]|uniref:response regulator n=1 Tax=Paenibacillus koleovorans TaxID=121608 RepID=UPI000FD8F6DD|nr:response regulator [Paenibacillus koleovorans]
MMNAILIDDEQYALQALQDVLSEFKQIQVVGTFTNPLEAIEHCPGLDVDVVFLDVEMPGMDGLQVAGRLLELCHAEVVFVTAYDQYAVEAFELNALDYLLKPVGSKRMEKAVQRLAGLIRQSGAAPLRHVASEVNVTVCSIQCMGKFRVLVGSEQNEYVKWRMSKVKELFAYLVHNKDSAVHRTIIMEQLWPDMDIERAMVYLHTCVYQIRKLIKAYAFEQHMSLRYVDEGYQLRLTNMTCDADEFIRMAAGKEAITSETIDASDYAADLYRGDYMGEDDFPWTVSMQTQLQFIYKALLKRIVDFYLAARDDVRVVTRLKQLIEMSPYQEEFHELLLQAYIRMGDVGSYNKHYESVEAMFRQELGIDVPASIRKLLKY